MRSVSVNDAPDRLANESAHGAGAKLCCCGQYLFFSGVFFKIKLNYFLDTFILKIFF